MRYILDHIAFRTLNKQKAVDFFINALGYRVQENFEIRFDDKGEDTASCTALEPSDRVNGFELPSFTMLPMGLEVEQKYVLSPEIFVSEGTPGSIVHDWALKHGGAAVHHFALRVPDNTTVEAEMQKWLEMGWTEGFTSDSVMKCDGLSQIFTKPSDVLGVIFELIQRDKYGFCKDNVKDLQLSTKGL